MEVRQDLKPAVPDWMEFCFGIFQFWLIPIQAILSSPLFPRGGILIKVTFS